MVVLPNTARQISRVVSIRKNTAKVCCSYILPRTRFPLHKSGSNDKRTKACAHGRTLPNHWPKPFPCAKRYLLSPVSKPRIQQCEARAAIPARYENCNPSKQEIRQSPLSHVDIKHQPTRLFLDSRSFSFLPSLFDHVQSGHAQANCI